VHALTRKGRVETTNYRTLRLPTGMDLPAYLKRELSQFYRAMLMEQVRKEDMRTVLLEYARDMAGGNPCAADPLSTDELRQLGAFWLSPTAGPRPPGPATSRVREPPACS
jgi:hypothetical protein